MIRIICAFLCLTYILSYSYSQQTVGLFLNSQNSYNGYTLFPTPSDEVFLIDNCGSFINKWQVSAKGYGTAELLPDGDLLKSVWIPENSFPAGGTAGKIERYSWEGELEWEMTYLDDNKIFHHDLTFLPNGNIIFLAWERKSIIECEAVGRAIVPSEGLWSETIIEIKPIGNDDYEIVWKWDIWDHLVQNIDSSLNNFGIIKESPHRLNINTFSQGSLDADWLHFNAIDYNESLDQIIVSSRSLNEIFIIDHSTTTTEAKGSNGGNADRGGDFLFRWGNPINYNSGFQSDQQLFSQHNAQWIPADVPGAGNILVFNNGSGIPENSQSSSIVEISPILNAFNYDLSENLFLPESPIWEYTDNPAILFYSSRIASCQRLPNGNTLINEGQKGRFFEVDTDGIKHWEYINPVNDFGPVEQNSNPNNNAVFSINKYGPTYTAFDDRDLTPLTPIETNPIMTDCQTVSTSSVFIQNHFIITNPIIDQLNIIPDTDTHYMAEIFSMQGIKIKSLSIKGKASISTSDLPQGLYILRLNNKSQIITKI